MSPTNLGLSSILIAERDLVARESLSELFRSDGHSVYEGVDSNEAIFHLQNKPGIKVVLIDVEMDFWKNVVAYAQGHRPARVIVGMGTLDTLDIVLETRRVGVDEYMLKPLTFDEVCERIAWLVTYRLPR